MECPRGRALFTGLLGGFLLILTGGTAKLQAINTDLEKEITEAQAGGGRGHSIGRYRRVFR